MIFVDSSNCSCYVFREAFIKMTKKLSAFICFGPKSLSSFVKYLIYGPPKAVKYSIYGPKNIFRVGNIIHRVERKRSLWIGTTRKYFLLIKAFSYQMSRYGFFFVVRDTTPTPGGIYSEPLTGAPDNSLPRRVRDPSKVKKYSFSIFQPPLATVSI